MQKKYIRYNFTRQSFFDLIWSKPAKRIAAELNIKYKKLRTLCINFDIPRPNSSYWAISEKAKKLTKPSLAIDSFPKDHPLSIRTMNPRYNPPTVEDDNKLMIEYFRIQYEGRREKKREKYVRKLIATFNEIEEMSSLSKHLKRTKIQSELEDLKNMISWIDDWIAEKNALVSIGAVNAELTKSNLFSNKEIEVDLDEELKNLDDYDMDHIESFMNANSDYDYGEEIIEWKSND